MGYRRSASWIAYPLPDVVLATFVEKCFFWHVPSLSPGSCEASRFWTPDNRLNGKPFIYRQLGTKGYWSQTLLIHTGNLTCPGYSASRGVVWYWRASLQRTRLDSCRVCAGTLDVIKKIWRQVVKRNRVKRKDCAETDSTWIACPITSYPGGQTSWQSLCTSALPNRVLPFGSGRIYWSTASCVTETTKE